MSGINLPPALSEVYVVLKNDVQYPHKTTLTQELEGISKLIALIRTSGPSTPDLDDLFHVNSGITVGPDNFCQCCLRPFEKKDA